MTEQINISFKPHHLLLYPSNRKRLDSIKISFFFFFFFKKNLPPTLFLTYHVFSITVFLILRCVIFIWNKVKTISFRPNALL